MLLSMLQLKFVVCLMDCFCIYFASVGSLLSKTFSLPVMGKKANSTLVELATPTKRKIDCNAKITPSKKARVSISDSRVASALNDALAQRQHEDHQRDAKALAKRVSENAPLCALMMSYLSRYDKCHEERDNLSRNCNVVSKLSDKMRMKVLVVVVPCMTKMTALKRGAIPELFKYLSGWMDYTSIQPAMLTKLFVYLAAIAMLTNPEFLDAWKALERHGEAAESLIWNHLIGKKWASEGPKYGCRGVH